jgi:hypothetical protein
MPTHIVVEVNIDFRHLLLPATVEQAINVAMKALSASSHTESLQQSEVA